MVKQITFKNLYQMDKFVFIAALFDPLKYIILKQTAKYEL